MNAREGHREGHIERLDLERFSDNPLFNTKAVVQQTGVPAPTLRAWEHRYTILSPGRAGNDYRLYSERDIALIGWLKERVDSGMAISQAIALLRHLEDEHQRIINFPMAADGPDRSAQTFMVTLPASTAMDKLLSETSSEPLTTADVIEEASSSFVRARGTQGTGASSQPVNLSMHAVREQLIESFKRLDDARAQPLLASMLAVYSVEQVCIDLITPTMWQIGQMWEKSQGSVATEHFASNFFRSFLTNLLFTTYNPGAGPLVIIGCAPGEPHELASLMLALFLRRQGVRIAYLGQSVETASLVQTARELTPRLICVSVTMPAYLATLIDLGRQIQELEAPRPLFIFGGQAFVHHAQLASHVPGRYLSGDLQSVVSQILRLLSESKSMSS